jgi:DNA-binding NtrC family response regulator
MKKNASILVADDDPDSREILSVWLKDWGYEAQLARDGQEALVKAEKSYPSIVLSDVRMPKMNGLELVRALKQSLPYCATILITAHADIKIAVEAIKEGAVDYILKPIDYDKLKALLDRTSDQLQAYTKAADLTQQLKKNSSFGPMVGATPVMREVYELIKNVAPSTAPVLVVGESGTGKELVASMIHNLSPRYNRPFIAVNSSALPETLIESELFGHDKGAFTGAIQSHIGCFERANRGTLFLDEISEMPIALQPKLLRVLEDGRVRRVGGRQEVELDVRFVAATNRDPYAAIKQGTLLESLFYRLNVFTIKLPPLHERKEDIPILTQYFINTFNRRYNLFVKTFSPETEELLCNYRWPGNIRELKNVIERSVIICKGDMIQPEHLPLYFREPEKNNELSVTIPLGKTLRDAEKMVILRTLEITNNNKAEAARILGVDVKTIRNKLKSLGWEDSSEDEDF